MSRLIDIGVYPVIGETDRFHVRSAGKDGLLYLVDLNEMSSGWCGCKHFEYKLSMQLAPVAECKHIRFAKAYRRLQQQLSVVRGTKR